MLTDGDLLLDRINKTSVVIVIRKTNIPGINSFWILHITGILKGHVLSLNEDWILERYAIEQALL